MAETKNTKAFYNTEIPRDWDVKELGEIGELKNGINKEKEDFGFGFPMVNLMDVFGINKVYKNNFQLGLVNATERDIKEYSLRKGDVLFIRSSVKPEGVGLTTVICDDLENTTYSGFIIRFRDNGFLNLEYKAHCFFEEGFRRRLLNKSTISANTNINQGALNSLQLPLPPLPEQKAIAQVLSTADAAIHTTEKLIAQKELRKKWLMQQLLSGKKRLKGFDGEWKECQLGDLGDSYNGLTGKTKENFGIGFPFITYMNVFSNSRIDITQVDHVVIEENENQNTAKYGDFFFTVSSETPNEVGMASVLLDEVENLYLNSFCFGFRLFDFETLNPKYAQFLLRFQSFREQICLLAQGSTRFNISKNGVKQILLSLPSIEEQTAIAQVLQAADKEISLLKAKAEKLREQKKGLMQVLLTGKKRLNYDSSDFYDYNENK